MEEIILGKPCRICATLIFANVQKWAITLREVTMNRSKVFRFAIPLILALFYRDTAPPAVASPIVKPRLYGSNRYETSIVIAKQFSDQTVENIVLASGTDYPDALSASVLAHKLNSPILLVKNNTQGSMNALEYIGTHLDSEGTVYIIGGHGIIGSDFESNLTDKGYKVKRLGGVDRYDTDILIANELNNEPGGTVFIASGENYPDVLSVSSFASSTNSPILIVKANTIPQEIQEYLRNLQPEQVYIAGGTGVVSSAVENEIQLLLPNATITRFAGKNRYETASLAYNQFAMNPTTIYVASGVSYPDALSGTTVASQNSAPILLLTLTHH